MENEHKLSLEEQKAQLDLKHIHAEAERKITRTEFEMKKASIASPTQLQMIKLKTVKDIHSEGSFNKVLLDTSSTEEPMLGLIEKFISMTKPENKQTK